MYKVINEHIENYLENKKLIDRFWMHYEKESSIDSQIRILEDIVNIQSTIHDWYTASRKFVGIDSGVYK